MGTLPLGFVGVDPSDDAVPDESIILRFRHLLESHQLPGAMFATVRKRLERKGILLKCWTIVGARILNAPTSECDGHA